MRPLHRTVSAFAALAIGLTMLAACGGAKPAPPAASPPAATAATAPAEAAYRAAATRLLDDLATALQGAADALAKPDLASQAWRQQATQSLQAVQAFGERTGTLAPPPALTTQHGQLAAAVRDLSAAAGTLSRAIASTDVTGLAEAAEALAANAATIATLRAQLGL